MRCVVTGSDRNGNSFVVRQMAIDPTERTVLWETASGDRASFPTFGSEPREGVSDLHVPPGAARWVMRFQPPNNQSPMHWTETVDFDFIVGGQIDLVLDAQTVPLNTGDCVVIAGVRHAWRTDPHGCLMLLAIHGESSGLLVVGGQDPS